MGFYKKIFASQYDRFMRQIENDFDPIRSELISKLEGQILDVGSGTGVNFKYYSKNAKVIAIEPSPFMVEKAKEKLKDKPHIKLYNLSVNDDKLENIIKPNSLDYVVTTLVLCTIPDYKSALKKFYKWLKTDGELIVLEHIHAKEKPRRVFQNIINPVWKVIGDGCHLNRDTDVAIKSAGFVPISESYFKKTLLFYKGIFKKIL
jgi:ubiquinone/menaquinone biosynthesis C-methylase UbiE